MPGIGSEQPEGQLGKAKSFWLYLFSPSSDSSRCEWRAGWHAGACCSTDGHLLLDTVSPFPSFFSCDLGRACHCRFSHLSLSWGGHIALLLPRWRHLRACGYGSCLSLADEQRWPHRSDRGSGEPPCWGHRPGNKRQRSEPGCKALQQAWWVGGASRQGVKRVHAAPACNLF